MQHNHLANAETRDRPVSPRRGAVIVSVDCDRLTGSASATAFATASLTAASSHLAPDAD